MALALTACADRRELVVAPPPAPTPTPVAILMPKGGYPGMAIPARLPDGRYATPNRDLSAVAGLWHWRVALNVAALACRGPQGETIVASYNALLLREKSSLAAAEKSYAAEFKAGGGADWRDRYDDAMTRLYNFFSAAQVRDDFCAAAADTLADAATIDDSMLPAFAVGRLAVMEKPFTDFFAAYDAWRSAQAAQRPIYALAATTPPAPLSAPATQMAAPPSTPAPAAVSRAKLILDPSVFQDTAVVH